MDEALKVLFEDYRKSRDEALEGKGPFRDNPSMAAFVHQEGYQAERDAEGGIDHSGLAAMHGVRKPEEAQQTDPDKLADQMRAEFSNRYGYEPSDETVKLAAAGFRGNIYTESGREAFYGRVASYDGRAEDTSEHAQVTSGRGGGNLASRVSAATAKTFEEENREWVESNNAWRYKGGFA